MLSETKVTFFGILVLAISGASCSSNEQKERLQNVSPVTYTHLTLPTILLV